MDLATFLEKAPKLNETARFKHLEKNRKYYEGTQYADRPLDASGYSKGQSIKGTMAPASWDRRDPGAVWNLRREVIEELTSWSLGGELFCHITIPDDVAANAWLTKAIQQAGLANACVDARNIGGSQGTAIMSFAIRNGEICLETHEPVSTWVLEWADRVSYRPRIVAKVFCEDDPFALPGDEPTLMVRLWTDTEESYHRRVKNSIGVWVWEQGESVTHGLGFCPVYWMPQSPKDGEIDGDHDGEHTAEAIDDANYQLAAASATTRRNAEDTLVVKEDPSLKPTTVYKGALGAIFARGGAEYLSQDGSSAKICIEVAEKRAQHVLRASRVVIPTSEELGRATTGEMLKRLYAPMLQRCAMLREQYEKRLIVPLLKGILAAARKLPRGSIVLPPDVDADATLGAVVITPVLPGKSSNIVVTWPQQFQPTAADRRDTIQAASQGTGAKPVLSLRTAVAMLQSAGVPIEDVEAELDRLEEDGEKAAENAAKALGMVEPPGSAGPVGGAEDDGEEAPESEREDTAAE